MPMKIGRDFGKDLKNSHNLLRYFPNSLSLLRRLFAGVCFKSWFTRWRFFQCHTSGGVFIGSLEGNWSKDQLDGYSGSKIQDGEST